MQQKLKDLDKTSPFTHDDFEPDQDKSPFRVLPVLRIKPLTDEQGKKWKAAVYLLLAKSQPGATP